MRATLKPCLECGTPTHGSRCPVCRRTPQEAPEAAYVDALYEQLRQDPPGEPFLGVDRDTPQVIPPLTQAAPDLDVDDGRWGPWRD